MPGHKLEGGCSIISCIWDEDVTAGALILVIVLCIGWIWLELVAGSSRRVEGRIRWKSRDAYVIRSPGSIEFVDAAVCDATGCG